MRRWLRYFETCFCALGIGILVLTSLATGAAAQVSGITPEQLQQLQQQRSAAPSPASGVTSRETILEPTMVSAPLPITSLEQIYSERVGTKLRLFGYDQIGQGRAVSLPQVGAMQDGYILGTGDEIVLTLRGQENSEYHAQVDRDGNVTFPKFNPVSAAGRSFGQFRSDLAAMVRRAYPSTETFITVGRIRQINVVVSGEVGSPGVRTLTGLSTVVDAIFVSGGIKKSGSIRNVHVVRNGRTIVADLYGILVGGTQSKNVVLAEGDRIVVPALGGTIAVTGEVRRPAIYELPAGRSSLSVRKAVELANGMALRGAYTVSLLRTQPDGKRRLVDVSNDTASIIGEGEIILVKSTTNISVDQVKLVGAVRSPGIVALGKFKTLHDLIPSAEVLKPDAYMLLGIIDRTDPVTLRRSVVPFSPLRVVEGRENQFLASNDTVRLLTKDEMLRLLKMTTFKETRFADELAASKSGADAVDVLKGGETTRMVDDAGALGTARLPNTAQRNAATPEQFSADGMSQRLAPVPPVDDNSGAAFAQKGFVQNDKDPTAAAPADVRNSARASLLARAATTEVAGLTTEDSVFYGTILGDYWVSITGGIRNPGTYLVAPGTSLEDVLTSIGGLVSDADRQQFEITSTEIDTSNGTSATKRVAHPGTKEEFARVIVKPFDKIEFRLVYSDKYSGYIKLEGEVRYPGVYSLVRNERLSSVLRRAGGYTEEAFPEGAVMLRTSVARAEDAENKRIIADLRNQLLTFVVKPAQPNSQPPSPEAIKIVEGLLVQMEQTKALGRVPVVANLERLDAHPNYDVRLEAGDSITVPKIPSTVLVVGEVLRAGAQSFDDSYTVDDYIEGAGGVSSQGDASRVIVVLPNGSIRKQENSWLNFGFGSSIPPGSTVFVPRDLEVYSRHQMLIDALQIFSQLATSAAALAVLSTR